jgi:hypothetical protein
VPIRTFLGNQAFDPEAIQIMNAAFEDACRALQLADRHDPITEVVAKRIIEIAGRGERDPARLRSLTLKELGLP